MDKISNNKISILSLLLKMLFLSGFIKKYHICVSSDDKMLSAFEKFIFSLKNLNEMTN